MLACSVRSVPFFHPFICSFILVPPYFFFKGERRGSVARAICTTNEHWG